MLFPSVEAFENHDDFDGRFAFFSTSTQAMGPDELRHRLKAAGNTLPVIATGNDTAVRVCASVRVPAYLTKPFSAKSLIEPLERASAGRSNSVAVRC